MIFLAFVILASSALSIVTPHLASAAAIDDHKQDYDWQIQSLIMYRALGDCIVNGHWNSINSISKELRAEDARSGKWFTDGNTGVKPAVGPYFRGDVADTDDADVRAPCGTVADVVGKATSLWKIDKTDLLCEIGAKRTNGREGEKCKSNTGATGNFDYSNVSVDKYRKYIQNTVYGKLGEPGMIDAYWYFFYLKVFKKSCVYKFNPLTDQSDIDALEYAPDTAAYHIKIADPEGSGKLIDQYYRANLERSHTIATRPAGIEGSVSSASVDRNCGTKKDGNPSIEDHINQYAPAAALLIKQGVVKAPNVDSDADALTADSKSSCSIEGGVGWWLCPIANFVAGLTDSIFDAVTAFLRVSPVNLSPNDNPLYTAWATMRTIANVAFVVVFLIIIFSQLSSLGITNYGVKKMLPRLVIAAILVNVSYYLCAIAIDISNIVGVSLQDALNYISEQTPGTKFATDDSWQTLITSVVGGTVGVFAAGAFAGIASAGPVALLAGIIPLLFGALFALVVAFLVLLARQALIIMAVVIAPLAFVAYLLPNTEGLFKKWRSLFVTLLALFPMMALVFGGSQLASVILRESSRATLNTDQDMIAFFLYVGSFAVQAIPLFITPVLIKLSSGVLGRFAGLINNPNRGPIDRARKWAQQKADNSANASYARRLERSKEREKNGQRQRFRDWGARRRAQYEKVNESVKQQVQEAETGYIAKATKNERNTVGGRILQRRLAGTSSTDAKERVLSNAIKADIRQTEQRADVGDAILEDQNFSGGERTDIAEFGRVTRADGSVYVATDSVRRAAIIRQMATGSYAERKRLIDATNQWKVSSKGEPVLDANGNKIPGATFELKQLVADGAAKSAGLSTSDPALAGQRINNMTQGSFVYDTAVVQAYNEGKYTSEALTAMHNDARNELIRVAIQEAENGKPQMLASLQQAIAGIQASKEIEGKVAGNMPALADMAAISQGQQAVAALVQGRAERSRLPKAEQAKITDAMILEARGFSSTALPVPQTETPPAPIPATPIVTPDGQITPPTVTNPDEYHDGMTR